MFARYLGVEPAGEAAARAARLRRRQEREATSLALGGAAAEDKPTSLPITLHGSMSTRRLIFAALLCGLAILVAFTIQITLA